MGDLSINFLLLEEKIMFKSHLIKSNQSPEEKLSRYLWSTGFALDYSVTVLAAKMCTNFHEHSMYIKFLWASYRNMYLLSYLSKDDSKFPITDQMQNRNFRGV